jgi:HK97 gp10 family phage protein
MIEIGIKLTGDLDSAIQQLGNKISGQILRSGAQAAAQAFYDEAKLRVPVSKGSHIFYGSHSKYLFQAGTLRDSIYQVYSVSNSSDDKATYHISWNHRKAPYGFMVEYGTSNAPANPFMRPAFDAAKAIAAANCNNRMAGLLK